MATIREILRGYQNRKFERALNDEISFDMYFIW